MKVVKRDGRTQDFSISKIKVAISFACEGLDVNPLELESKFDGFIFDGVTTDSIQENLILHAKNLSSPQNDKWLLVAGRLATMNRWGTVGSYKKPFTDYVKGQIDNGEWKHENFKLYTQEDLNLIGEMLVKDRDLQHTIASVETANSKYLNKNECIQTLFMGNAMLYASVEKTVDKRMKRIKEFYELLSNLEGSLASPNLMNARKGLNNASCFILAPNDDVDSIFNAIKDIALISKNGGGLGWFLGYIRAKGSSLMDNPTGSGGVLPLCKVINDVLVYINQAGKRKGAGTLALPIWHNDITDFLDIQTEVGDPRSKSFDIQPQVTIFDLFMQKVEINMNGGDEDWYTFCPHEVKTVLGIDICVLFNEDFNNAYRLIVDACDKGLLKVYTKHKVKSLWIKYLQVFFEKGRPYPTFVDAMNRANPNKHDGVILCGNLCVAPETEILTRNGYQIIADLEGKEVDVWNGVEWSTTTVVKTSPLENVVSVSTDDGATIDCTQYHKWYVVTRGSNGKLNGMIEKRTHELEVGDELIKSEDYEAVAHGINLIEYPYESGFVTGDGCERGRTDDKNFELKLYKNSNKFFLKDLLRGYSSTTSPNGDVVFRWKHGVLLGKYKIPDNSFVIEDRLAWLAGLIDADGSVLKGGESFILNTSDKTFAQKIKLFLQELGVDCTCGLYSNSKTTSFSGKNSENYKEVSREPLYVVRVHAKGVTKLLNLGLSCKRLNLVKSSKGRSTSSKFVKIVSVEDFGRTTPVFCFTEPKRNMGMFNGILTGQCQESFSNTKPDVYHHTCSLMSLVVGRIAIKDLSNKASLAVRMLNNAMMIGTTPVEESANHLRDYRTIGIGIQGLCDIIAREWKSYSDLKFVTEVCERIQYGAVRESIAMAKEYGAFPKFKGSRWDIGDIFDEYNDNSVCPDLDWLYLKGQCQLYGIYNSQLTSPAPNTSTSIFMMAGAGFMPSYAPYFYEDNMGGKTPVSSMFLQENPLFYSQTLGHYDQAKLTKAVGAGQKFVDTGISAEYLFDRNIHNITAIHVRDLVFSMWKNGCKTGYYLRTIKKGEAVKKTDDSCIACAG